jgi:hypothetical protein
MRRRKRYCTLGSDKEERETSETDEEKDRETGTVPLTRGKPAKYTRQGTGLGGG